MNHYYKPPSWFTKAINQKRHSHFVNVENCKIHYQRWAQPNDQLSKPALLFVHGGGAHSHWWDFIAPSFLDEYDVLAIDLSGMGESEHRDTYSDSLYAKELVAVCRDAGHLNNISIISHSYGGRSVLTLALEKPEILKSIIITDCTLFSPTKQSKMLGGKKDIPASPFGRKKIYPTKTAGLERFKLIPPQSCDNQFLVDYIADFSLGSVEGGWSWKFDMDFVSKRDEELENYSLLDRIGAIECPVANLYGENSLLFPENMVQIYKEKYPEHTRFYRLENARHHLLLDQPEAFIRVLKQIMEELEPSIPETPMYNDVV